MFICFPTQHNLVNRKAPYYFIVSLAIWASHLHGGRRIVNVDLALRSSAGLVGPRVVCLGLVGATFVVVSEG